MHSSAGSLLFSFLMIKLVINYLLAGREVYAWKSAQNIYPQMKGGH
jgi:hypothetical protein